MMQPGGLFAIEKRAERHVSFDRESSHIPGVPAEILQIYPGRFPVPTSYPLQGIWTSIVPVLSVLPMDYGDAISHSQIHGDIKFWCEI